MLKATSDWSRRILEHPRIAERENHYIRWYPKKLVALEGKPEWMEGSVPGIYVHVPFCDEICAFCPFYKRRTEAELVDRFVRSLLTEINLLADGPGQGPIRFIYMGGGTPSVLNAQQVGAILERVSNVWGLAEDAEISMEVHPTHARASYFASMRAAGVNRVSMGIQSFVGDRLRALKATHREEDSIEAVKAAVKYFDQTAIDLLYDCPNQSLEAWLEELRSAISDYEIPHLSCYALVPINPSVARSSNEDQIHMAVAALQYTAEEGFEHYASCASGGFDVARPGHQCRYEREHWQAPQAAFYGLGPGAFGFVRGHTTVNCLDLYDYFRSTESGRLPLASAVKISVQELKHRYFVLGVKCLEIDLADYQRRFQSSAMDDFGVQIRLLLEDDFAVLEGERLKLSPVGRLFVDTCSEIFFSTNERGIPHPEEGDIRALFSKKSGSVGAVSA